VIGLDTNVLVRYLMQDDARQAAQATKLLESLTPEAPGFVPIVTVVEFVWVLSSCFDLQRSEVVQALDSLLRTKELVVERVEVVWKALRHFRHGSADFADSLIARSAAAAGCERTVTFDRAAAKHVGMSLLS
jgi:predicted nucleic-acid-binding protein